jgi:hypothetical protein
VADDQTRGDGPAVLPDSRRPTTDGLADVPARLSLVVGGTRELPATTG